MNGYADVMVTSRGELPIAPLLAAVVRELDAGATTRWRCHSDVGIVCLVLEGQVELEAVHPSLAVAIGADEVAVVSTGARLDYRWRAAGGTPARILLLWFHARSPSTGVVVHRAPRARRIGVLAPIPRPPGIEVSLHAAVMAVGTQLAHDAHDRRCYILPTVGAIEAAGATAVPGDGVVAGPGRHVIRARESTEVIVVDLARGR